MKLISEEDIELLKHYFKNRNILEIYRILNHLEDLKEEPGQKIK